MCFFLYLHCQIWPSKLFMCLFFPPKASCAYFRTEKALCAYGACAYKKSSVFKLATNLNCDNYKFIDSLLNSSNSAHKKFNLCKDYQSLTYDQTNILIFHKLGLQKQWQTGIKYKIFHYATYMLHGWGFINKLCYGKQDFLLGDVHSLRSFRKLNLFTFKGMVAAI